MFRKYSILILSLATIGFFYLNFLQDVDQHFDFLSPLLVLLTILNKKKSETYFIAYLISTFLGIDYLLHYNFVFNSTGLRELLLPLLFVWGFTFSVIRYKESIIKLNQTTELQHAIFEFANEGIIITNSNGDIILANPTVCKQFGYSGSEFSSLKIEDIIPDRFRIAHPELRNQFISHPFSRTMGKGRSLFALRKNKTEFPVDISLSSFRINNQLYVISFIIDITGRIEHENLLNLTNLELESKVSQRTMELASLNLELASANSNLKAEARERTKIEEALRDSERLYSTIAHNLPDGIICVLNEKLNIVFIDGRELDFLNIKRDKIIGNLWTSIDLCKSSKIEEITTILKNVFKWNSCQLECEHNEKVYSMNAVPLPDTNGNVKEILMVIRNITNWRNAEKELHIALDKEKELNEMKSRFVSMASHEFRTPLSTILSSVSLVDRYHLPEDREKQKKHIERIKSSIKNLTEILNDFLSLEKLEAGKVEVRPEKFDISEFCYELTNEIQMLYDSGKIINYKYETGTKEIESDKQLLRNILNNLLSNAMKYSLPNSTIQFTTIVGEEIIIKVKDQGIGIPDEDQKHLFERFFRAKNASNIQGTGLGLNIVSRYISLLNGQIHFESKLNEGTTFTISLPHSFQTIQNN